MSQAPMSALKKSRASSFRVFMPDAATMDKYAKRKVQPPATNAQLGHGSAMALDLIGVLWPRQWFTTLLAQEARRNPT